MASKINVFNSFSELFIRALRLFSMIGLLLLRFSELFFGTVVVDTSGDKVAFATLQGALEAMVTIFFKQNQ